MEKRILFLIVFLYLLGSNASNAQQEIVGLYFKNSELRFAKMQVSTGEVEIISPAAISPDAFQSGVADYDPFLKRYFYMRGSGDSNQLYTVDATTGEAAFMVSLSSSESNVVPLANFAFNWLDEHLYGLKYDYMDGVMELRLTKVNPETGETDVISEMPFNTQTFSQGNSDIDPINRRYFFVASDKLFTIDLDSGEPLHEVAISFPPNDYAQFFMNMTYDWVNDKVYGVLFNGGPPPNPLFPEYTGELRLASIDVETGVVDVISEAVLSPDGFNSNDCDIDPVSRKYYYLRQNSLYVVDLDNGELLDVVDIQNTEGAVAPIINMSLDDLAAPPADPVGKNMVEAMVLSPGETLELDVFVGENVSYLWSDGLTSSSRMITEPGTYGVTIIRGDLEIQGQVEVTTTTSLNDLENELSISIYPNPTSEMLNYSFLNGEMPDNISIVNSIGEIIRNIRPQLQGQIDVSFLPEGVYFIKWELEDKTYSQSFVKNVRK